MRRKRDRLSAGSPEPAYPKKIRGDDHITISELVIIERALADGLDPNLLWEEEDLVIPQPTGGCVLPRPIFGTEMWPHYNTPLHRAIHFADFESADLLLRHGADVDLYNSLGRTPLHEAVWNWNHDTVRFLLARGANVHKATVEAHVRYKDIKLDLHGPGDELCLQRALHSSDHTTLRLLVDAGVDLSPDSQRPWTALDLALLAEDRWAVDILLPQDVELPVEPPTLELAGTDYAGDAQRLLAFTKTRDLIPPSELYRAYCYAVWQVKERGIIGPSSATIDVDDLIRGVFGALQDATRTNHEQPHQKNTCASCRAFQSEASRTFEANPLLFQLYENRDQLNVSARKGCPLCAIAADALDAAERKAGTDDKDPGNNDAQKLAPNPPVSLETTLSASSSSGRSMTSPVVICGELSKTLGWMSLSDISIIPTSKGPDDPDSTGSASAMHVARKWLQACKNGNDHSACRQQNPNTSNVWPSRLLLLGEPGEDPRIVAAKGIQSPYCALSYCWGEKGTFTTTRDTISQNMSGIPLSCLPAVMVDAMSVARTLGYQYLWIDALCIVQDDEDDWESEAARLYAIYSNADLTISTLFGSDSRTSLFQPCSLRAVHPVPLDIWEPKQYRSQPAVFPEWTIEDLAIRGPVHSRAWTLQEQLLSTRILYFGRNMLHWECLSGYWMEADPLDDPGTIYPYRRKLRDRAETKRAMKAIFSKEEAEKGTSWPSLRAFEFWKEQLEEFTRRELSYASDRLPAFASISKTLASVAGQQFLGGIWTGDRFPESLCWRVTEPRPRTGTPSMPSWTWASVDGEISFDAVERSCRKGIEVIPSVTVESLDVEANESMSWVSGSITIRGKLCRKKPLNPSIFKSVPGGETRALRRQSLEGCVFLDHAPECIEDVYVINVLSFPRGPPHTGFGHPRFPSGRPPMTVRLLLQRVRSEVDVFRRIGIGIIPGPPTDIECKVDGRRMSPLGWLVTDEEVFEDRRIVIF